MLPPAFLEWVSHVSSGSDKFGQWHDFQRGKRVEAKEPTRPMGAGKSCVTFDDDFHLVYDPTMKAIEVSQAQSPLADYVKGVQTEPLVVTVNGTPAAVLLSLHNADLETIALSTNPEFIALIERSRARASSEGGISPDEMRRRVLTER